MGEQLNKPKIQDPSIANLTRSWRNRCFSLKGRSLGYLDPATNNIWDEWGGKERRKTKKRKIAFDNLKQKPEDSHFINYRCIFSHIKKKKSAGRPFKLVSHSRPSKSRNPFIFLSPLYLACRLWPDRHDIRAPSTGIVFLSKAGRKVKGKGPGKLCLSFSKTVDKTAFPGRTHQYSSTHMSLARNGSYGYS